MQSSVSDWLTLEAEFLLRQQVRRSLRRWAQHVLAPIGQSPARHHDLLIAELEALAAGKFLRLMVLMPPGSAKSTYASVLFPTWWYTQFPTSSIIAASHTAGLALHFSRRVRDIVARYRELLGYQVTSSIASAHSWTTSLGGEYIAAGIRGAITGRRADLAIIDDPIKSQFIAESSVQRGHIWDWYRSDLVTRLKPNARIVLIMTRWHEDDLGGHLLSAAGPEWRVLRLPALAEPHDPLGREIGEPLWPQWEGMEALSAKRDLVGSRIWSALYQQSPRQTEGTVFNTTRVRLLENAIVATDTHTIRAWDLAATLAEKGSDPDWTVGVKISRDAKGYYTILDVIRLRGSPSQIEDAIRIAAKADGEKVWIGLPEDPGQAGKSQAAYMTRQLSGYRVITARESGSKLTRALPVASQMEVGNICAVQAAWNRCFFDELAEFPLGRKDDQVDALVRGFTALNGTTDLSRFTSVPFFGR